MRGRLWGRRMVGSRRATVKRRRLVHSTYKDTTEYKHTTDVHDAGCATTDVHRRWLRQRHRYFAHSGVVGVGRRPFCPSVVQLCPSVVQLCLSVVYFSADTSGSATVNDAPSPGW